MTEGPAGDLREAVERLAERWNTDWVHGLSMPNVRRQERQRCAEHIRALLAEHSAAPGALDMIMLRRDVLARDRADWTRQEWVDEAREIMDDLHGSAASLLNGHVLALLSAVTEVEDKVAAGYAEGYEAGRGDYIAKVAKFFDELIGRP